MYYIEVGGKPEVTVSQTCVCSHMFSRATGLELHIIGMYVCISAVGAHDTLGYHIIAMCMCTCPERAQGTLECHIIDVCVCVCTLVAVCTHAAGAQGTLGHHIIAVIVTFILNFSAASSLCKWKCGPLSDVILLVFSCINA